jgi:hypothetical protein
VPGAIEVHDIAGNSLAVGLDWQLGGFARAFIGRDHLDVRPSMRGRAAGPVGSAARDRRSSWMDTPEMQKGLRYGVSPSEWRRSREAEHSLCLRSRSAR